MSAGAEVSVAFVLDSVAHNIKNLIKGTQSPKQSLQNILGQNTLSNVNASLWSMRKKKNTPWALYQLNVMVFWTLGMPVVNKFPPKNFLQKLPDFSGTNRFLSFFT